MGFTKLDDRLGDSSIMAVPSDTFKVFIYILSRCGPDGISRISASGISSHCFLDLAAVHKAIETLEAPDPDSRTTIDEGRRIRKVDGGFLVINYQKYRERGYSSKDSAVRMRRKRAQEKKEKARMERERKRPPAAAIHRADAGAATGAGIRFDGSNMVGITDEFIAGLEDRFPVSDIRAELGKMCAWLKLHPESSGGDLTVFIDSWLRKPSYSSQKTTRN
jgi:hypothetical protein